jgi:hypothetical protein
MGISCCAKWNQSEGEGDPQRACIRTHTCTKWTESKSEKKVWIPSRIEKQGCFNLDPKINFGGFDPERFRFHLMLRVMHK